MKYTDLTAFAHSLGDPWVLQAGMDIDTFGITVQADDDGSHGPLLESLAAALRATLGWPPCLVASIGLCDEGANLLLVWDDDTEYFFPMDAGGAATPPEDAASGAKAAAAPVATRLAQAVLAWADAAFAQAGRTITDAR